MTDNTLKILDMKPWHSKVLRAVAWILGYRGEYVYCITMNVDLNTYEGAKKAINTLSDSEPKKKKNTPK